MVLPTNSSMFLLCAFVQIGLAVGDIELIRKTADMRKIAGQIEFLKEVESRYPRIFARWFYIPDLTDKPNRRTSSRLKYGVSISVR